MANNSPRVWIVLAVVVEERHVVSTAGCDLGRPAKTELVKVPRAIIWKRSANETTDVEAARAWAHSNQEGESAWQVLTYPNTERDPLGKARRAIMGAS